MRTTRIATAILFVFVTANSAVAIAQQCTQEKQPGVSTATVSKWHELESPPSGVTGIAFSPDGRLFAMTTFKKCSVWSVADRKLVRELATEHYTHSPVFGPGNKTIMIADGKGNLEYASTFRVFNIAEGTDRNVGKCTGVVHDVAYSADRRVMATVSSFGPIGAIVSREKAGFDACGEITLIGADLSPTIYCPIAEVPRDRKEYEQLLQKSVPFHLALNADGSKLAAANKAGLIRIYDTKTGQQLHELEGGGSMRYHADGSLECATHIYSADGKLVKERPGVAWQKLAGEYSVKQAQSGQVSIQHLQTKHRQWLSAKPFRKASRVTGSSDGRYVAVAESKVTTIYQIGTQAETDRK